MTEKIEDEIMIEIKEKEIDIILKTSGRRITRKP